MKTRFLLISFIIVLSLGLMLTLVSCPSAILLHSASTYAWDCSFLRTTTDDVNYTYTGGDNYFEVQFTESRIIYLNRAQGATFAADGLFDPDNQTVIEYVIDKNSKLDPFTVPPTSELRKYAPVISAIETTVTVGGVAGPTTKVYQALDTRSPLFTFTYSTSQGFEVTSVLFGQTLYKK